MSWPPLVVAVAAAGPWLTYAVSMSTQSRDGLSYISSEIDRVPAQSALALAMVALPTVAALGWLSIRLAACTAAVVGAGFGSFAVLYPDHLASPGAAWGAAAIVWSVALIVVGEVTAHLRPGIQRASRNQPREGG
jgi:hypothetical protein